MSYYRIYPNKNTTIFKKAIGSQLVTQGNVNTGANPIAEIYDGNGQSTFLMGFDLSPVLTKLQQYTYTCNLKVYDAGTLFEPAIIPKPIDLLYFTNDFTEGDGFSFLDGQAVAGFANLNNRTAVAPWTDELTSGNLFAFTMQKANEDWIVPVTTFIADSVGGSTNPNFGLRVAVEILAIGSIKLTAGVALSSLTNLQVNGVAIITAPVAFNTDLPTTALDIVTAINTFTSNPDYTASIDPLDNTNVIIKPLAGTGAAVNGFVVTAFTAGGLTATTVNMAGGVNSAYLFNTDTYFTKFVYTRHTRTIHQPYLEFFIQDEVKDGRYSLTAGQSTNLYLLNDTGSNFVGTVTAKITDAVGTVLATPTVINPSAGVYFVSYTPLITDSGQIYDDWSIDGSLVAHNINTIQSPNVILSNRQALSGHFFYPTTSYLYQTIRKNDVAMFEVISEIRGKGTLLKTGFEFKIMTTSAFEVTPWTSVQVYNNRHYFVVDTSFLFPDLEYEVFVRLNENGIVKTGQYTYKFRLQADEPNHLDNKNASPYNDRDYYLKK